MGEDMPIELRPKFNFHIFNIDSGDIVESLWDVQYSIAMDHMVSEYFDKGNHGVELTRATANSPEEVDYTNVYEMKGRPIV